MRTKGLKRRCTVLQVWQKHCHIQLDIVDVAELMMIRQKLMWILYVVWPDDVISCLRQGHVAGWPDGSCPALLCLHMFGAHDTWAISGHPRLLPQLFQYCCGYELPKLLFERAYSMVDPTIPGPKPLPPFLLWSQPLSGFVSLGLSTTGTMRLCACGTCVEKSSCHLTLDKSNHRMTWSRLSYKTIYTLRHLHWPLWKRVYRATTKIPYSKAFR